MQMEDLQSSGQRTGSVDQSDAAVGDRRSFLHCIHQDPFVRIALYIIHELIMLIS